VRPTQWRRTGVPLINFKVSPSRGQKLTLPFQFWRSADGRNVMTQPKSIDLDYPKPLAVKLEDLSQNKDQDNMPGKKYFLIDTAFSHLQKMNVIVATKAFILSDATPYEYTDVNKSPAYFL
jgi:hypothetical protein